MAFGIQIKNNDNEIIVDSDFSHYHFAGKASHYSTTEVPEILGGNNTAHSTTSGQYMSSGQQNGKIMKFTLAARASDSSPAPMCFIKPNNTNDWAGIVLTRRQDSNWDIWVLVNTDSQPELYCFLPLDEMSLNSATAAAGDDYGIATFDASNKRTYDSRIKPLKILSAFPVTAKSYARTSVTANSWDPDFEPNDHKNISYSLSSSASLSDLMYFCPSIAHCCQEIIFNTDGEGFQSQGYNSYFYAWARGDLWWCFYRNTFRLESTSNFQSGYSIYASGHVWKSIEDSSGIFAALAAVALSFATFGASLALLAVTITATALTAAFTGTGLVSGYYRPYSNDARNQDQIQTALITKASYYD